MIRNFRKAAIASALCLLSSGVRSTETSLAEAPAQQAMSDSNAVNVKTHSFVFPSDAARQYTDQGLQKLIGNGTFNEPQVGSALSYRSLLYATSGDNALEAFYTNAITAFSGKLLDLLSAEEDFRAALRADHDYEDALDGLLEVYYARAEGFMLIGNEYLAKAYRQKFDRRPNESRSIVDLELADIESSRLSYESGIREFMKLFNPEFIGTGGRAKPYLNLNAERMFFTPRPNKWNQSEIVSFESRRGQTNAIGHATRLYGSTKPDAAEIRPVQGSPSLSSTKGQGAQVKGIDAPVVFLPPQIEKNSKFEKGGDIVVSFYANIDEKYPVTAMELLLEFDNKHLQPPKKDDIRSDGCGLDMMCL